MKIRRIRIENFRSIKKLEIRGEDLLVLIGPNNHGKSNILLALGFFFEPASKVQRLDLPHDTSKGENLLIEVEFDDLSSNEQSTFKTNVLTGNRMIVRKKGLISDDTITTEYKGIIETPAQEWLQPDKVANFLSREKVDSIKSKHNISAYFPPKGRITKELFLNFQKAYIRDHSGEIKLERREEDGLFLGRANVPSSILGDFVMVPAVRDISAETRVQQSASFGKLLAHTINEMAQTDTNFKSIKQALVQLVQSLQSESGKERPKGLRDLEVSLINELQEWGVDDLQIDIKPPALEELLQVGASLLVDDGVMTPPEQKGHGLQRIMLFSLIRTWVDTQRATRIKTGKNVVGEPSAGLLVLGFEEPELFLHPQAQRQIFRTLSDFAKAKDHQVILCTHSPAFINAEESGQICVVYKPSVSSGTAVMQGPKEVFVGSGKRERKQRFNLSYWLNPDRAELFFADKVVLVEGPTEKSVLSWVANQMSITQQQEVSIIDCCGKYNLLTYIDFCKAFNLNYLVIHDEDPIKPTSNKQELKNRQRTYKENSLIEDATIGTAPVVVVCPKFESLCGTSDTAGKSLGKPLASLEKLRKDGIPAKIKELTKFVFNTKESPLCRVTKL